MIDPRGIEHMAELFTNLAIENNINVAIGRRRLIVEEED